MKIKNSLGGLLLFLGACQDTAERKEPMIISHSTDFELRHKIGQMIMVGFQGTDPTDPEVKVLESQAQEGLIGGVIFFAYNIKEPAQVKALTASFKQIQSSYPLLLAIDQEGGKVQRLNSKNGFQDFMSAKKVTQENVATSTLYYQGMAKMVKDAGFNMVLGPVVDLEYNPNDMQPSPVIGALERSYGSNPETVYKYATSFIDAFHQEGIETVLKHFPGHGYAQKDSHQGMVDVTLTHDPIELIPFYKLMKVGKVDAIMTAHLINRHYDANYPATLSKKTLRPLLRDKGYQGVIISDCLHMKAIQQHYAFNEIIVQAINAGVDILLFSNNKASSINTSNTQGRLPSPQLVQQIIDVVEEAVTNGTISPHRIEASFQRIVKLKENLLK